MSAVLQERIVSQAHLKGNLPSRDGMRRVSNHRHSLTCDPSWIVRLTSSNLFIMVMRVCCDAAPCMVQVLGGRPREAHDRAEECLAGVRCDVATTSPAVEAVHARRQRSSSVGESRAVPGLVRDRIRRCAFPCACIEVATRLSVGPVLPSDATLCTLLPTSERHRFHERVAIRPCRHDRLPVVPNLAICARHMSLQTSRERQSDAGKNAD